MHGFLILNGYFGDCFAVSYHHAGDVAFVKLVKTFSK